MARDHVHVIAKAEYQGLQERGGFPSCEEHWCLPETSDKSVGDCKSLDEEIAQQCYGGVKSSWASNPS